MSKEEKNERRSLKKYLLLAIVLVLVVFFPTLFVSGDILWTISTVLILFFAVGGTAIFIYVMSLGLKYLKNTIEIKNKGESEKEKKRRRSSKRAYKQLRILLAITFIIWGIASLAIPYGISSLTRVIPSEWALVGIIISDIFLLASIASTIKKEKTFSVIKIGILAILLLTTFNLMGTIPFIWTALLIFLAGLAVWILKSLPVLSLDEMGVVMILGVGVKRIDSGMYHVPWFFRTGVKKFPKTLFNLNYRKRKVVTDDGKYKGKNYGSVAVEADAVAYVPFPQDDNLIDIAEQRIPIDEKGLLNWTEEAVISSIRLALGGRTWKEATVAGPFEEIRQVANERFTSKDGILVKAGFRSEDLRLAVEEIELPGDLEKALLEVDKARLARDAAVYKADEISEISSMPPILGVAKQRGIKVETVQNGLKNKQEKYIKNNQELWDKNWDMHQRRMTDGKSYKDLHINMEGSGDNGGITTEIAKILAIAAIIKEEVIKEEMSKNSRSTKESESNSETTKGKKTKEEEIAAGIDVLGL